MSKKKNSKDAILLAAVKIFSLGVGTISTMLLSKILSLEIYGTYSTLNLIATTGASISVLGLADAVNYFYNSEKDIDNQKKYINSIFSFQFLIGIITTVVIILSEPLFIQYFENPLLKGMCIYVAFRPYLENTIISLQNLQVAIGKAKQIAIRNAIVSAFKVITIIICTFYINDIRILLIMICFMDFLTVIYFAHTFAREKYTIKLFKIDQQSLIKILSLSIPMGVYVMSNTLMRDLDKYVIGYFESTSVLAIYTNCSSALPLDIITNSFLIVMIPLMTRAIANDDYSKAQNLFKNYLMIGLHSTVVFGIAIMLVAEEAISLLYSDKYLPGKTVFLLYLIVSIIKFANLTLVLSAKGKTKMLMNLSLFSLVANLVLNILFYRLFGFYGPAIATVLVTLISIGILTIMSCRILQISPRNIINFKEFFMLLIEIGFLVIIFLVLRRVLYYYNINKYMILIICAGGFSATMFFINFQKIGNILKQI